MKIFRIDAADGVSGERDDAEDRAYEIESDEFGEVLGFGGEDGSDADVVRAVAERLFGLWEGVRGESDEAIRSDDFSSIGDGEFVLSDMDSIGIDEHGDIGTVVDNEGRSEFPGPFADAAGVFDQSAIGHVLFAELDDTDSGGQSSADDGAGSSEAEVFGDEKVEGVRVPGSAANEEAAEGFLEGVEFVAELFDLSGEVCGEEFAVLFESPAGFLRSFEIRPEDIIEGFSGHLAGERDAGADVLLGIASGEKFGLGEISAGCGEAMSPTFDPTGTEGIVGVEAEVFLDDADSFAEAVA